MAKSSRAQTAEFWCRMAVIGGAAIFPTRLLAHGGNPGDHLAIGYYFGHDGTFEAPANPPQPATLLVDTHPWELPNHDYDMTPSTGILQGWSSGVPGFATLDVESEEYDGHGFYSYLNPNYNLGTPDLRLHLDHKDTGFSILNPTTLQTQAFPLVLGSEDFHAHLQYFVPLNQHPAEGTIYTATFHLSDASGHLADSEPFTVRFEVVPEPATVALMLLGAMAIRRPRHLSVR